MSPAKTTVVIALVSFALASACTRQDGKGSSPPIKVAPRVCPVAAPDNGSSIPKGLTGVSDDCHADSDCTAGRQGRCSYSGGGHAVARVSCTYDGCSADGDCPSGSLCICGDRNECIVATCHDDVDCGGKHCETSYGAVGADYGRYCHGSSDKCESNSDCKAGKTCAYVSGSSRWECLTEIPHPVG